MKAYAIKDRSGTIYASSIDLEEEDCKDNFDIFSTWEQLEEEGYRCVPVEITEIKTDK